MVEEQDYMVFLGLVIASFRAILEDPEFSEFTKENVDELERLLVWKHSARFASVVKGAQHELATCANDDQWSGQAHLEYIVSLAEGMIDSEMDLDKEESARAHLCLVGALQTLQEDFDRLEIHERAVLGQPFMTEIRELDRFWFEFGAEPPKVPHMLQFAFTFLRHGGRIPTRPNVQDARPSL